MQLRGVQPDLILSSCSLRTQETADGLGDKLEYEGSRLYLKELYLTNPDTLKETLIMQEKHLNNILVVGHNPQLTDMVSILSNEHISKIPTLGVVAIRFDIKEWSELKETKGKIDFFIYPKQFKYYVPNAIQATLNKL